MKATYSCIECGYETPRWMGKCTQCGAWGSMKEVVKDRRRPSQLKKKPLGTIHSLDLTASLQEKRQDTHFVEFNRVLGGGIVKGGVVLLGGEPGVGKTTLLLQVLANMHAESYKCMFVSGEESFEQISLHAQRLKVTNRFDVMCDNDIDSIVAILEQKSPAFVILDSIQTVKTEDMRGLPGGIGQVKECTSRIVNCAKQKGISIFLIGHITKDGTLAGPKILEHLVDAVLYLEGDKTYTIRLLRGIKNRFGSTREIGVFTFENGVFSDAVNPAEMFVRSKQASFGISKGVVFEGNRAMLVEVQALVTDSSYSAPQRVVSGIRKAKVQMICALLSKYTKADILTKDVYVNIANGLKVDDASLDLAVCSAILSSYLHKKVAASQVAIGEVSLTGHIYEGSLLVEKVKALQRLGYQNIILPKGAVSLFPSPKKFQFIDSVTALPQLI